MSVNCSLFIVNRPLIPGWMEVNLVSVVWSENTNAKGDKQSTYVGFNNIQPTCTGRKGIKTLTRVVKV